MPSQPPSGQEPSGQELSGQELLAFDQAHVWHPYAAARPGRSPRLVTSASGARLHLADGTVLVDGMSSWWAAIHGYRHPTLDAAARDQLSRMSNVMFGGLTHAPAVQLAKRLLDVADPALRHVFYCDSGSSAVEVAIKMCLQRQRGRHADARGGSRFLALRGGFHGDTFAAMSIGDPEIGMHDVFAPALPTQVFAPLPPAWPRPGDRPTDDNTDDNTDRAVAAWAEATERLASEHAGELAGIVAEPVLQSARGMRLYAPGCLRVLRRIATRLDIPFVVDEVASGFGRLGTMFGYQLVGVAPDILCLGKALTGGYLTLGAVLCTPQIAADVDASPPGALLHGPTYTGNPLACAVAAANLDLLATGAWRDDVARIETGLRAGLDLLHRQPHVRDVQVFGAFAAVRTTTMLDLPAASDAAVAAGAWLRPFRDIVYAMPPYISTNDEIDLVTAAIRAAASQGRGSRPG